MVDKPFEAIVIGSGATGGVATLTLAKAGIRVLLVERGPELNAVEAFGDEPINTFRRISSVINGEYLSQHQHPGFWKTNPKLYANKEENPYSYPKESPFIWTQGHQVGGRSLTWGGITLRLSNDDLKASQQDGYGPEWPISYEDLSIHYSSLEKFLNIYGHKDRLKHLPDGEYHNYLPFTESEKYFAQRVEKKLGYKVIHSRGFGPYQPGSKHDWPLSSSPGSTLKQALQTGKVEILSNHIAEKLIINKGKNSAEGLIVINRLNGKRKFLKASLVVLCASTIQSLRLLLNSEKTNNSEGFIDYSGQLGKNLMDHISTCRFFTIPSHQDEKETSIKNKTAVLSGAGSFFIPFGSNHKNTTDFIRGYGIWGGIDRFEPPKCLKRNPSSKTGFLIGHGEVLPHKENKVTLSREVDKYDVPIPYIKCTWRENEKKMVKHMNQTIEETIKVANGEIVPFPKIFNFPFLDKILTKAVAIQNEPPPPGYYIHEVGGAPMGKEKDTSVIDKWNRLWDCKNVLVVDGACWPTSSWQSPTLTMMAITKRACENAIQTHQE